MLQFRPASPALLDELCRVDIAAWGEDMAATREMLQRRMEVNPMGNYVAIESVSGRIAGSVWTLWVSDRSFKTWLEATGDGLYDGSHSPYGEVLFGANISVDRAVSSAQAVGPFLIENVIGLVSAMGRQCARMGGRMSGYRPWSKLIAPADYIRLYRAGSKIYLHDVDHEQWRDGGQFIELLHSRDTAVRFIDPWAWPTCQAPLQARPFDPDLASFTSVSIHGKPLRIVRLLPDYFSDPDSCDNGVLLEWVNDKNVR